ncbi:MAG TPA: alpha/beta fold hydrolase [Acidimicrobiales bacterium]|jgi:hypothetical protein|nr:alpha/beta fold hydrolase [Acidimicrobiales bacterium]
MAQSPCEIRASGKPSAVQSESTTASPRPAEPGSVSGAPNLPAGFTDTCTSRYIDTGELRQPAVIGGDGPPLLLVHGWPQNWYARRLLMPALARDFEVIAVDQRGMRLSDKPQGGYDAGTLAGDLVASATAGCRICLSGAGYGWAPIGPEWSSETREDCGRGA